MAHVEVRSSRFRGLGDATQDAADTATAQAQHAAALAAYNARAAGDFAAYSQAVQTLYSLGIKNVASATQQDLLDLAANPPGSPGLGAVVKALEVGAALFGLYLIVQLVRAFRGPRG